MSVKAKSYMNNAILKLIKKYKLTEHEATELVRNSYLYESLLRFPEETIHDDLDSTVDAIYREAVIV